MRKSSASELGLRKKDFIAISVHLRGRANFFSSILRWCVTERMDGAQRAAYSEECKRSRRASARDDKT